MKKLAYLLFVLPAFAFACPDLTGDYHCSYKNRETGAPIVVDIHIKFEYPNSYTISLLPTDDDPMRWTADEAVHGNLHHTPEGDVITKSTLACEGKKLHLNVDQVWYHDEEGGIRQGAVPAIEHHLSQFLSLDKDDNLFREDNWVDGKVGKITEEHMPITCTRLDKKGT